MSPVDKHSKDYVPSVLELEYYRYREKGIFLLDYPSKNYFFFIFNRMEHPSRNPYNCIILLNNSHHRKTSLDLIH